MKLLDVVSVAQQADTAMVIQDGVYFGIDERFVFGLNMFSYLPVWYILLAKLFWQNSWNSSAVKI